MSTQNSTPSKYPEAPTKVTGVPLPEVKVQPVDPTIASSEVAVARREAQHAAGDLEAPTKGESPVAGPIKPAPPEPRTAAEIQADMEATRARLQTTLGQLKGSVQDATSPKLIAERQVDKVKNFYVDEYGAVRPERVAGTVGAVVGVVVLITVTKRIFS